MSGESSVLAPNSGLPEVSSLSPCGNECQALQACKTGSFLFWPHLPASMDMALLITFNLQLRRLGVRGFLAADSAFISLWLWRGSVVAHSRIQPWTCIISSRPLQLHSSWPLLCSVCCLFCKDRVGLYGASSHCRLVWEPSVGTVVALLLLRSALQTRSC